MHGYKQKSLVINGVKHKCKIHMTLIESCCRARAQPGGSCSPVPGRVGAELHGLPGCLEPRQVTEDRGAHEARARPPEGAHLVGLQCEGQSYGEPSFHRVRWSRAGPSEQDHQKGSSLKGSRVNLSNVHESSCPRTQSKAKSQPWTSSSPSCRVVT